jgi:3'(2'), 5'-bisphosphate nucleotidase
MPVDDVPDVRPSPRFVLPSYPLFVRCSRAGMWTLDPIDGTKGFLRGGQYAVCLALLVDARVELGVIGCPNLPSIPSPFPSSDQSTSTSTSSTATPDDASASANTGDKGALFVAVRGHGAHQLPLLVPATPPASGSQFDNNITPHRRPFRLDMPRLALHELSFLESVEKAHAALDTNARVAARLGVRAGPVRMDSQAKYAALVRGDGGGGVYLRLPVAGGGRGGEAGGYQEKIWVRYCNGCFSFCQKKKT